MWVVVADNLQEVTFFFDASMQAHKSRGGGERQGRMKGARRQRKQEGRMQKEGGRTQKWGARKECRKEKGWGTFQASWDELKHRCWRPFELGEITSEKSDAMSRVGNRVWCDKGLERR